MRINLHKAVDISIITSFILLSTIYCRYLFFSEVQLYLKIILFISATVIGSVISDFGSGIVHWLCDNYGSPTIPIIGKYLIFPFREHHLTPSKMTKHDFFETNGTPCLLPSIFLILSLPILLNTTHWAILFLSALIFTTSLFGACTNQFHKWAHEQNPPLIAKLLQKSGLIINSKNHNIHHEHPHNTYYCITTGWLNYMLRKINAWGRMENLIFRLTKIKAADYDLDDYRS